MSDRKPRVIYAAKSGGEIIYIGQTANFRRRVAEHRATSHWCVSGVFFKELATVWGSDAADEMEHALISQHAPQHNVQFSPRKRERPELLQDSTGTVTIDEAAAIIGKSRSSVSRRVRAGQIRVAGRIAGATVLNRSDVEAVAARVQAAA